MQAFMIYVLEVNLALLVFYLAYRLLLSNLTFYHFNRFFLLFAFLFSAVYPFIDFSTPVAENVIRELNSPVHVKIVGIISSNTHFPDYWSELFLIFIAGAVIMTARLLAQLSSLYRFHLHARPDSHHGIDFMAPDGIAGPFSFWKTIYVNPLNYSKKELEIILKHEWLHISQLHTIDVMLAEFIRIIGWFNPAGWLLSKAVKENHEFIVDRQVLQNGISSKDYQYLLLQVNGNEVFFSNAFGASPLKERISKINKRGSSGISIVAYMILPVVVAALVSVKIYGTALPAIKNGARDKTSLTSQGIRGQNFKLDTIPGTIAMLHTMQLKTLKSNKEPLKEIIFFTKNTQGVGMDLYVKFDGKEIETMKVLALAAPDFKPKQ